jgi:hypothetical protein
MPVHRVPGGKGGVVFAYTAEIDAWLASRVPAEPAAAETASPVHEPDPRAETRARRVWVGVAATLVVLVGVAGLGVSWVRSREVERGVSHLALRGHDLVALDAAGEDLWTHRLPDVLPDATGVPRPAILRWGHGQNDASASRVVAPPLEPTGEVLALIGFARQQPDQSPMASDAVYRFSRTGRLEWQYTPDVTFEFAGQRFASPWMTSAWATGAGTGRGPLVAFIHHTWWPSFLVSVDDRGAGSLVFVNAGHIVSLARVERSDRRHVLVGGVNNEFGGASVAVLAEGEPPATSPQTPGSAFACAGCPDGRPLRYLVFPRSDVTVALGMPYNFATDILETATGDIDVSVREHSDPPLRTVYHLTPDFVPASVARADMYWATHERLWAEGRIGHSAADCPERTRPFVVRIWEPASGWREVSVPPAFGGAAPSAGR